MKTLLFLTALLLLQPAGAFAQTVPPATNGAVVDAPVAPPPEVAPAAKASGRGGLDDDLSPEVLARLSDAQVLELLKQREKSRAQLASSEPPMVAIVVPIAAFLTTFFIVFIILRFRAQKHARLHETMQKMIEKGIEIPASLFLPPQQRNADLRKGLILMGAGLGIAAALYAVKAPGAFAFGLIPLLIGLGYVVVWRIERKES